MKIREYKLDSRKRRLRRLNHFFLASAALFLAYQNLIRPMLAPQPEPVQVPIATQAAQHQPQTPPPGVDPEEWSGEEVDLSVRPEERLYSPRVEYAPIDER
ncbi:MAG TPA: hypothetical protein VKY38_04555 [Azoarcus sp.]|nr:hypothetical protein [Azoarcus sp.]